MYETCSCVIHTTQLHNYYHFTLMFARGVHVLREALVYYNLVQWTSGFIQHCKYTIMHLPILACHVACSSRPAPPHPPPTPPPTTFLSAFLCPHYNYVHHCFPDKSKLSKAYGQSLAVSCDKLKQGPFSQKALVAITYISLSYFHCAVAHNTYPQTSDFYHSTSTIPFHHSKTKLIMCLSYTLVAVVPFTIGVYLILTFLEGYVNMVLRFSTLCSLLLCLILIPCALLFFPFHHSIPLSDSRQPALRLEALRLLECLQ